MKKISGILILLRNYRRLVSGVIFAATVYFGVVGALYLLQSHLIFRAGYHRPNLTKAELPRMREIYFPTLINAECSYPLQKLPQNCNSKEYAFLLAWYAPPLSPSLPTILYLHGNGGTIQYRRAIAKQFLDAGFGLLMLEYRGYGGNPGDPTPRGLSEDAYAALKYLQSNSSKTSKIFMYGESIGAAVAIDMLRRYEEKQISGLILYAPFTNLTAVIENLYPWLPVRWILKYPMDNLAAIQNVRVPLLIMHGSVDRFVPTQMSRDLFDAANSPKELFIADGANHYTLWDMGGTSRAIEFIHKIESGLPVGGISGDAR